MDSPEIRHCAAPGCDAVILNPNDKRRKYCTARCRDREMRRRQRAKAKGEKYNPEEARFDPKYRVREDPVLEKAEKHTELIVNAPTSARRGTRYLRFVEQGWPELITRGVTTVGRVAEQNGWQKADVSRWLAAWREDLEMASKWAQWEAEGERPDVAEDLRSFESFRHRYFPEFDTPGFQSEWAEEVNRTLTTGGKLLLLAPQRHGKTEFMAHYCLWRIVNDPDIRIMWVSKNVDIASKAVSMVRMILEEHPRLAEDILGPGKTFRPDYRSPLPWTTTEITVNNRTKFMKSATMVALGRGGSILSRDADLIIIDDPQEHTELDTSPTARAKHIEWFFTDFMSRKEEHTGIAFIGSRQHLEDIPSECLERGGWKVMTYHAHDPSCEKPKTPYKDHEDCVLWPKKRSYRWLMDLKRQIGEVAFERNMQNNPTVEGYRLITADDIDRIRDRYRRIGDVPKGCRLIAGLDPASGKPNAAVLYAYGQDGMRHIVDAELFGPGLEGARDAIGQWWEKYRVGLWVVERNNFQGAILQDLVVRRLTQDFGIRLEPHFTGLNKWDDGSGVTAMFARIRAEEPTITIPDGDEGTREKMDRLVRQWLLFSPQTANHKASEDDLVMASWFPHLIMDKWMRPVRAEIVRDYRPTPFPRSKFDRSSTAPWSA